MGPLIHQGISVPQLVATNPGAAWMKAIFALSACLL